MYTPLFRTKIITILIVGNRMPLGEMASPVLVRIPECSRLPTIMGVGRCWDVEGEEEADLHDRKKSLWALLLKGKRIEKLRRLVKEGEKIRENIVTRLGFDVGTVKSPSGAGTRKYCNDVIVLFKMTYISGVALSFTQSPIEPVRLVALYLYEDSGLLRWAGFCV